MKIGKTLFVTLAILCMLSHYSLAEDSANQQQQIFDNEVNLDSHSVDGEISLIGESLAFTDPMRLPNPSPIKLEEDCGCKGKGHSKEGTCTKLKPHPVPVYPTVSIL